MLFTKIMVWWLIWDNMILDRFTHKCSLVNWFLVSLLTDPFRKRLTSCSLGLPQTVCSFVHDFVESVLNFQRRHLPAYQVVRTLLCASTGLTGTWRMRFKVRMSICDGTRKNIESRTLNPGLTASVKMVVFKGYPSTNGSMSIDMNQRILKKLPLKIHTKTW